MIPKYPSAVILQRQMNPDPMGAGKKFDQRYLVNSIPGFPAIIPRFYWPALARTRLGMCWLDASFFYKQGVLTGRVR